MRRRLSKPDERSSKFQLFLAQLSPEIESPSQTYQPSKFLAGWIASDQDALAMHASILSPLKKEMIYERLDERACSRARQVSRARR